MAVMMNREGLSVALRVAKSCLYAMICMAAGTVCGTAMACTCLEHVVVSVVLVFKHTPNFFSIFSEFFWTIYPSAASICQPTGPGWQHCPCYGQYML